MFTTQDFAWCRNEVYDQRHIGSDGFYVKVNLISILGSRTNRARLKEMTTKTKTLTDMKLRIPATIWIAICSVLCLLGSADAQTVVSSGQTISFNSSATPPSYSISGSGGGTGTIINGEATFNFSGLSISNGATVSVAGSLPINIVSSTNIYVNTVINVSAPIFGAITQTGGAGGPAGGNAGGFGGTNVTAGSGPGGGQYVAGKYTGGGGGFGGNGGGGRGTPNDYGITNGLPSLLVLQGGSGGSGGRGDWSSSSGASASNGGAGGGGGGALGLTATSGNITIDTSGQILANGGGYDNTTNGVIYQLAGAGGSGGAIRLSAGSGTVTINGVLSVAGGQGGTITLTNKTSNAGAGGGGGRIAIYSASGSYAGAGGVAAAAGTPGKDGSGNPCSNSPQPAAGTIYRQAGPLPGVAEVPTPANNSASVSVLTSLSWVPGSGVTNQVVYFGTNSTPTVTVASGNGSLNSVANNAMSGPLQPSTTYYWLVQDNGQSGLVWSFTTGVGKASNPIPANGQSSVNTNIATLTWTPDGGEVSYDVYFGTNSTAVANRTVSAVNVATPSFPVPGPLLAGVTYYWAVDGLGAGGSVLQGDLWDFATQQAGQWILTVAADGSGNFTTVQAAVSSLPKPNTNHVEIVIKAGSYNEHVSIDTANVDFVGLGTTPTNTVIWDAISSSSGSPEASVISIYTTNITFQNLTIQNTLPVNSAQANAINGQEPSGGGQCGAGWIQFKDCHILSTQDTMYLAGHSACPDGCGPWYFIDCTIAGTVDYICGDALAWFEGCNLVCVDRGAGAGGFVATANNRPTDPYGFVLNNCTITGPADSQGDWWLGRPWYANASTYFLNCKMDGSINPTGWYLSISDGEPDPTARYGEYNTMTINGTPYTAAQYANRAGPATGWTDTEEPMTAAEAAAFTLTNVMAEYNWNPSFALCVPAGVASGPVSQSVQAGAAATFTVTPTANSSPTYQWQVSTDGGNTFSNVGTGSGGTASSYTTPATVLADNGYEYRCVLSVACDGGSSATSVAATLTVQCTAAGISANPTNQTVQVGQAGTFNVTATGSSPTYQWEVSTDGGNTWNNVTTGTGGTTSSYTTPATVEGNNGNEYRCVASVACNSSTATSTAATLTVNCTTAGISTNPVNQSVQAGSTATFTVAATGSSPTYQWQVSTDGGNTWNNVTTGTGGTTSSYTTPATVVGNNGNEYQCVASVACNSSSATSTAATVTVNCTAAGISTNPVSQSIQAGSTATFTVAATGSSPTYQWEISTDGGNTWNNVTVGTGGTTSSYITPVTVVDNSGSQYRCVASVACNSSSATSTAATLTVTPPVGIERKNSNNSLSNGADWVGGVVPDSSDIAEWDSTRTSADANGLGGNLGWAGITILSPGGAVDLGTGSTLTLGASGIDMSSATVNLSYEGILALAANQTWNVASGQTITFSGGGCQISGAYNLTLAGKGTVTFTSFSGGVPGTPTYTGNTIISGGTLQLASGMTLPSTPQISIAAGATLDVSASSTYTWTSGTSLSASGAGTTVGASAAAIKGGTTVNLGSQAITLALTPTGFTGDSTHPALLISQGALTLNGNTLAVSNAAATPLGAGTYSLIQVIGGTITGSPNAIPIVTGAGLASGCTASNTVSGGNVNLVVTSQTVTCTGAGISTNPVNQTVPVGSTATFAVTATGSSPTYQWEVSTDGGNTWSNVTVGTGGTTSSYTTPAEVVGNSGNEYRCVASVACNSSTATSSAATLTVTQSLNPNKLNTTTMNGGTADWTAAPTASSVGEFSAIPTASTLASMTLGGNLALGGLQFDSTMPGPLTIASTGGYTLTNGASGINATNNATLNCAIYLGANQSWNVNSGNTITVGGVISGANTLTLSGLGTVKLAGANTFTNTTTVTAGTLQLGSSLAFTNATFAQAVPLALSGSAIVDLNGYNAIVANINASASTATITDNGSGTGTDTLTITNNNNPNLTTVSALITDGPTRHVAVVMANKQSATAQFNLGNANTFSGGLTLINGNGGSRLRINGTLSIVGSAGAITSGPFGTGPITIGQVATDKAGILWSSGYNSQTLPNNLIFNTTSYPTDSGMRVDSTGIVLSGTLTASNAPVTFCSEAASPGGAVSLTGQVTGTNPNGLLLASDSGILTVTLNNGTAAPNNYAGTTVISTNTTLSLGAANQIPNGNGYGNVTDNGTLSLNGNSATINGLSGTGVVDGVSGTPTFTLGGGNASGSFSGIIKNTAGTLALTKTGTGLQTLTAANTYGGSTTVSAGTLQLQPVSAQSSPNPPSGSLLARYTFDNTLNDASGNGNNGAMSSGSAAYVTGHFSQAINFAGANYVTVPYAASFGTNSSYTMSAWINLNAVPGANTNYGIFGTRGGTNPGDTIDIKVSGTGSGNCKLHADIGTGSAWLTTAADYQANFAAGTWYLVTYVVNNTAQNVSIYVNGSLATTISFSGTPLCMQSGQYLCIGNDYYQSSEDMNGAIDEVCVYGRALSGVEVTQLYNGVSTGTGPLPAGSAVSVASGAALDLDGSAQTIASLSNVSGSGGMVTNSMPVNASLTISPAAGSATFSGNIVGSGNNAISLIVNGTGGTQVLAGNNTYSGATTISAGELVGATGGSCSNSAFTVASGATNGILLTAAGSQWVCAGLTNNGSAPCQDFNFNGNPPSTTVAPLRVNGGVALGNGDFIIRNGTFTANSSYPLLAYMGSLTGTLPSGSALSLPTGVSGSLSNSPAANTIYLVVTLAPLTTGPNIQLAPLTGTNLALQISASVVGRNYVLESTPSLIPPVTWTPVNTNPGTGGSLTNLVPVIRANTNGFFRYLVQ